MNFQEKIQLQIICRTCKHERNQHYQGIGYCFKHIKEKTNKYWKKCTCPYYEYMEIAYSRNARK